MSSTALIVRPSWLTRALVRLGLVRRAVTEGEHQTWADYVTGQETEPSYDPLRAMSALSAHPWLYAAASAVAADLAGLPLRALDATGEDLPAHPALDLLAAPRSGESGELWRRQLVLDLVLVGTAYSLVVRAARASEPVSLLRLHPTYTRIEPARDGSVSRVVYDPQDGSREYYDPDDVLIWRLPSWEADPSGLYGTGAVRPLERDLVADIEAAKRYGESAKRGRPAAVFRPDGESMPSWGPKQIEAIKASLGKLVRDQHDGIAILGARGKLEVLGWSPRDMEFAAGRTWTRDAVLAALGVPPTRVGLPTANYATAREQSLVYWQSLQGLARMLDAQLTRLARMFRPDTRLEHDFRSVDALQDARNDNLQRVMMHVQIGLPLDVAYEVEGYPEIAQRLRDRSAPTQPDEGDDETPPRAMTRDGADLDISTAEGRAAVWRGWLEREHAPREREWSRALSLWLRGWAERIATRLAEVLDERTRPRGVDAVVVRDLSGDEILAIIGADEEAERLRAIIGPRYEEAIERAYELAAEEVGVELDYDPAVDPADQELAQLIVRVTQATKDRSAEVIRGGLLEGATTAEIQEALRRDPGFSPMRALRIARTEVTRSLNGGTIRAFRAARDAGVELRRMWVSARDEAVRPEHWALDGQVRDVDEQFVVPLDPRVDPRYVGEHGDGPGHFASAGLVVNCRCVLVSVTSGQEVE